MRLTTTIPHLLAIGSLGALAMIPCHAVSRESQLPQAVDPASMRHTWRFFDHADGLLGGEIRAICQTRDGSVWFCGKMGVCRYDSTEVVIFDPETTGAPVECMDILEAADGSIWVASATGDPASGVSRYDGRTWTSFGTKDGLPGPLVKTLCEGPDGAIWAGCGTYEWSAHDLPGGLARFDGKRWEDVGASVNGIPLNVNAVECAADGSVWIGSDASVSLLRGGVVKRFDHEALADVGRILDILHARDGTVWFGSQSGVLHYSQDEWIARRISPEGHRAQSLQQSADGTLWAYSNRGLFRSKSGDHWVACPIPYPGVGDLVPHARLHLTPDGILWLGGQRAVRFDCSGLKWLSFAVLGGPGTRDSGGRVWFIDDHQRPVAHDGVSFSTVPDARWPALVSRSGDIWSGSAQGVASIDSSGRRTHHSVVDSVLHLFETSDGRIWVSGLAGGQGVVACYDEAGWETF